MNEVKTNEIERLPREIFVTIISNALSEPKTFKTAAVTLGDLKKEMTRNSIDYAGQIFQEGNTVTELLNDHAVLPRTDKNGKELDELVIMMTGAKKKINSGYGINFSEMKRIDLVRAACELVKKRPELKETFGNISITPTVKLVELMNTYANSIPTPVTQTPSTPAKVTAEVKTTVVPKVTETPETVGVIGKLGYAIFTALANFCLQVPVEQEMTILKTSFTPEQIEGFKKILSIKD